MIREIFVSIDLVICLGFESLFFVVFVVVIFMLNIEGCFFVVRNGLFLFNLFLCNYYILGD